VENLAELAKIELLPEEKQALLKDFEGILQYIKHIEAAEVGSEKEEFTLKNVWREDKVEAREFSHELIVKQFPGSQDGYLKVKKIL